jgi:hypothetical protein
LPVVVVVVVVVDDDVEQTLDVVSMDVIEHVVSVDELCAIRESNDAVERVVRRVFGVADDDDDDV